VRISQGRVRVINRVDLRDYLVSVVGSESLPNFKLEALKAQAVLAANVLVQEIAKNTSGGSYATMLKDSTQIQAYLGAAYERPLARCAVQAVFPQVLQASVGTKLLPVYYHSTCGGGTSLPEDVFAHGIEVAAPVVVSDSTLSHQSAGATGRSVGQAVSCHYCKASPFYKNLPVVFDCAQVRGKFGYLPIAILGVDKARRPLKILVEDARGKKRQISGYELWLAIGQNFGWGKVPGTRYDFKQEKDKLKFTSSGCGHGVGFCQWGAQGMALAGRNYRQILEYYFPGARLRNQ
jgi:stage II sporulation protein D